MNPKGTIIMQAEGVDEMTFSDPHPFSDDSIKFETNKLNGINLEDDIERVEVSSPGSSTNGEDFGGNPLVPEQNPNESIKSWLQRITELQKKIAVESSATAAMTFPSDFKPSPTPNRVVKYQDLPYMGEMTLDNSKPRRGRKPKKADICHLIYKNYGTIFPGTPNPKSYLEKDTVSRKSAIETNKDDLGNRSDVQNRIISSLLEKRLTQEIKEKKGTPSVTKQEPLNLCIRDLNHLKIRLLKKNDNTYTSEIKSEPASDDDEVEFVPDVKSEARFPAITPDSSSPDPKTPDCGPNGFVYWPNAGVFIHPMALQQQLLYYQRMAANNNYSLPNHSPRPPPPEGLPPPHHQELRKLAPKTQRPKKTEETDITEVKTTKRTSSASTDKHQPTKRKRSAIFIPPIPTENNTNPATEVSICKFKFTGGAKPSLQEKKMLSVDSGGNFRYYSGTGDKSMRGYEFFPRETLQQQINNTQGSSTGAFLQASGEKIYPITPIDFTGIKSNPDFLLTPSEAPLSPPIGEDVPRMKKRKSRKSLQREKLEQTFKEKGFLIQTQQLESAEGATYCKFRQLRKFTRYLFRSWKDYLPGNVRELQQEGEEGPPGVLLEPEEVIDNNLERQSSGEVANVQ